MKRVACTRAALILTDAWIGSSPSSVKFDFLNHPLAVVLLVMDSTQSSRLSWPAMMSTYGDTMAARCLSKLFDALKQSSSGSSNRQAKPLSKYPPRPKAQESNQYT